MLTAAIFAVVTVGAKPTDLTGAWTSKVQFTSGAFSGIKDLEFLMVFNKGGTMTESSNYDGLPPVPPAYGIWRKTGYGRFEARYVYYVTKPPQRLDDITAGGGWLPDGKGIITEKITLAKNGQSYKSNITLKLFDAKGRAGQIWSGVCNGVRMKF